MDIQFIEYTVQEYTNQFTVLLISWYRCKEVCIHPGNNAEKYNYHFLMEYKLNRFVQTWTINC